MVYKEKKINENKSLSWKKKASIFLILILVVSSITFLFFFWANSPHNNNYPPSIDRSIIFPRDEGRHNETIEIWSAVLHLKTDNRIEYEMYVRYSLFGGREISFTDEENVTGNTFWSERKEGSFSSVYNKLNLTFSKGIEEDYWYQMQDSEFSYEYSCEFYLSNGKYIYLDIQMIAQKDPILIGDKGKIFLWEYGTIFGYIQPRLTIEGIISIDGNAESVQGDCWIEHNWGGWSLYNQESWSIQLDDSKELAILRIFKPGTQEVFFDYFYLIDEVGNFEDVKSGDYTIEVLRYWRDPRYQKRCYSSKWRVFSQEHDIDLIITPTIENQLTQAYWSGSGVVSGEIEGRTVNGVCYAQLNHFYYTTLSINEVLHIFDQEIPTNPSTVRANITDDIPIANATIVYNINGGENYSIAMINVGEDMWEGMIPGQPYGSVINFYVISFDLSGNSKKSEIYISEVS